MEESAYGIIRAERYVAPAHYIFKIDSFSLLSQMLDASGVESYESCDFEASGYKWRLALYPNGDSKRNGDGHISLYLVMPNTNAFTPAWEVNAIFHFFVYNQLQDTYLSIGDGRVRRFGTTKMEWGFPQLLPLSTFNDASNGYLISDSCVFGVEVFVIKNEGKGEHLSFIKNPAGGTFTWTVENFSMLKEDAYSSEVYYVGGHQWKLKLYPNGNLAQRGMHLSLYLELQDYSKFRSGWKLFVAYKLRIRDQVNNNHHEVEYHKWFNYLERDWGNGDFISLTTIYQSSNGHIVFDTLIIEGIITCLSVVTDPPGSPIII